MRVVALIVMLGAGLGTAFGQSATPTAEPLQSGATRFTIDPESGSRLPLLTRDDMHDEASARIYDMLAEPGGEPPRGTIAIALYSPATAAALGRIVHLPLDRERPGAPAARASELDRGP